MTTTELKKPHPPRMSQQAGAISETPSTGLTLFALPWRFPETLSHPTYGPTQVPFPYEWLVWAHASQLSKSYQPSNSWPQWAPGLALVPASLDSQIGFTWESLSPVQVAAISDCFLDQARWPQTEYKWGLTLACTTRETPGPAHSVDSYRPCRSTTTLSLHSWSSTEGRCWW